MSKRILLVDISVTGHRLAYIDALRCTGECICLLPKDEILDFPYVELKSGFDKKRTFITYVKFINEINSVVKREKIDVVHFLCGDALYRFFGLGLSIIKAKKIVTFHHMAFSRIKTIAIKNIYNNITYGVVHTEHLFETLTKLGIQNVSHIEYPVFGIPIENSKEESRQILELPTHKKILAVMGGTQRYKGLDVLLTALNDVNEDFFIIICGPERDYTSDYILEKSKDYNTKVKLMLRFLDDIEFQNVINATDILLLPYTFEFDGASGPLAESTIYRKMVIASEHGSLGQLVKQNHLGYTFKTENAKDLALTIDKALQEDNKWDSVAESYRDSLKVETFQEKYSKLYEEE